jgi:hypothetical protein
MRNGFFMKAGRLGGLAGALLVGMGVALTGCAGDSQIRVAAVRSDAVDAPRLPTTAYLTADGASAEVYLTDLDPRDLDPGTDLARVSGRIIQFKMFLAPKAGSTPIESSACSVTVRHIVLAGGAIGVYSGGGFLLPRGSAGEAEFSGSVREATLRLTGQRGPFVDRLGPAILTGSFSAPRNEALARRMAARVQDILSVVEPAEPAGATGAAAGQ